MTPEVSVVVPAFNAGRYVRDAINSVLDQTCRNLEVVVVDDGSSDDTAVHVRSYGSAVRYCAQENQGVSAARNRGIREARGRYVAFLDADDVWMPEKLERQLHCLHRSVGRACYSSFRIVNEALAEIREQRARPRASVLEDLLFVGNVVGTPSTVVCERALLERVGGFDPSLSQCADWDMWIRLAALTEFVYVDEPLVCYRQHAANMSRNVRLLEQDSTYTLKKAFAMEGLAGDLRERRREALAHNRMVLAGSYFQVGALAAFARCALSAVLLDWRQTRYLAGYWSRHRAIEEESERRAS